MKLYLLRHGDAGDPRDWRGDDARRPLTDRGRKRMTREARVLERLGIEVGCILTSPLLRALQTAEIVASALGLRDAMVEDARLAPGFDRDALAAIVRDHAGAGDLLLVGHEPSMSATIGRLTGAAVELRKGGVARIDLDGSEPLTGVLEWLLPPKLLALG